MSYAEPRGKFLQRGNSSSPSTLSSQEMLLPQTIENSESGSKNLISLKLEAEQRAVQSHVPIVIEIQPSYWFVPDWIDHAVESLNSLLALEENWDSYGASRVDPETAIATLELLASIMETPLVPPSIVPTCRGNIQLEWHRFGIDLEVEVARSGKYSVFYEDESEHFEDEYPIHSVHTSEVLSKYLDRIRHRADEEEQAAA